MKSLPALTTAAVLALVTASGCSQATRANRHLERAEQHRKSGKFTEAAIEYRNALQIDRTNREAGLRLAGLYYELGRRLEAFPMLVKLRELEPENSEVREKLASIYLEARDIEKARAEALWLLEKAPLNAAAPVVLAEAARTPDEMAEAERILTSAGNPASLGKLRARGILELRRAHWDAAQKLFDEAQKLDPAAPGPYLDLARMAGVRGDAAAAEQILRAGMTHAPDDVNVQLALAGVLMVARKTDEGHALLLKITRQFPENTQALFHRARLVLGGGNVEQCSQLLDDVLRIDPSHVDARLLKIRIKLQKGDTRGSLEELDQIAKAYPRLAKVPYESALLQIRTDQLAEAAKSLANALRIDPDFQEAGLLLAELRIKRQEYAGALELLRPMMTKDVPRDRLLPLVAQAFRGENALAPAEAACRELVRIRPNDAQSHFHLGLVLRDQGRGDDAKACFENVLRLAPESETATANLIELDLLGGNLDAALARATEWIQRHPAAGAMRRLQARVLLAQGRADQAMTVLAEAIKQQPQAIEAYVLLSQLHASAAQFDQAIAILQRGLAQKRDDPGALMLLAAVYEKKGEFVKAASTYQELLATRPKFAPAMNNLAALYCERLNRLNEAQTLATSARQLLGSDPYVAATLGWVLYQKREFERAAPLLKEVAAKLPANAEFQCRLGMCYYMMNDATAARPLLESAIKSTAELPSRGKAARFLEVLGLDEQAPAATAARTLHACLAENPEDLIALLKLAAVMERTADHRGAKASFEKVLQLNPKSLPALVGLARLRARRFADPAGGLDLAEKARELAPTDPVVAHLTGRLACDAGNYQRGFTLLQEGFAKLPANAELQLDLALACFALGESSQALEHAQAALPRLDGERKAHADRLVRVATFLQNSSGSGNVEMKPVEGSTQPDTDVIGQMAAALACEQEGRFADAAALYERLLARANPFVPAMKRLATLWAGRLSKHDRAEQLAQKVRRILPNDREMRDLLADIANYKNTIASEPALNR